MCEYLLAVLPNGSFTTVVVSFMTIPWASEQREKRRVISRRGKSAGDIMWVRLPAPHIMVISRERENRRDQQAGDIMWVRLPAPHIMVISIEREREEEASKLVILCGLDYQHHT